MTEDERLIDLLRSTLPPIAADLPPRDLWPALLGRDEHRAWGSWADLALAVAVALAFMLFPQSLIVIAYHL